MAPRLTIIIGSIRPGRAGLGRYLHQHTNPAALKNAIDYLYREWRDKPVGFVSYGGVAAGTRAVQQLMQIVATLKMVPIFEAVSIPLLDELLRLERALRALRAPVAGAA